jgi:hypothetical protein
MAEGDTRCPTSASPMGVPVAASTEERTAQGSRPPRPPGPAERWSAPTSGRAAGGQGKADDHGGVPLRREPCLEPMRSRLSSLRRCPGRSCPASGSAPGPGGAPPDRRALARSRPGPMVAAELRRRRRRKHRGRDRDRDGQRAPGRHQGGTPRSGPEGPEGGNGSPDAGTGVGRQAERPPVRSRGARIARRLPARLPDRSLGQCLAQSRVTNGYRWSRPPGLNLDQVEDLEAGAKQADPSRDHGNSTDWVSGHSKR